MKKLVVALLLVATPLAAQNAERSRRLTAAAEQLLDFEKKLIEKSPDAIDDLVFSDVLSLLDTAISTNPTNVHARALRAQILLLQSYDGDGEYDVCYLLDAKADADYVVSRPHAAAADVASARAVLRGIANIPPDAIPDPPTVCNEDDEGQHGTRTKSR